MNRRGLLSLIACAAAGAVTAKAGIALAAQPAEVLTAHPPGYRPNYRCRIFDSNLCLVKFHSDLDYFEVLQEKRGSPSFYGPHDGKFIPFDDFPPGSFTYSWPVKHHG